MPVTQKIGLKSIHVWNVPPILHMQLQILAKIEQTTLNAVMIEAMQDYAEKKMTKLEARGVRFDGLDEEDGERKDEEEEEEEIDEGGEPERFEEAILPSRSNSDDANDMYEETLK